MTLDELQKFKVSPEDRNIFNDFRNSREWSTMKSNVEAYILKLTANLLIGTELEKDSSVRELERLRGFTYYWREVVHSLEVKQINEI